MLFVREFVEEKKLYIRAFKILTMSVMHETNNEIVLYRLD